MQQNERLTEREADVLRLLARGSGRAAGGSARTDSVKVN
jgi:DNA-binding CsgD family transcriptional regulator